jgi:hypothetical protein
MSLTGPRAQGTHSPFHLSAADEVGAQRRVRELVTPLKP